VRKTLVSITLLSWTVLTTSCAMLSAPVIPPPAAIQVYKAPLDIDNDETLPGTLHGKSSTKNVLGLVSWGDASIRAAVENGGISTIRSADYEFLTVLGIYSQYTTIVHGD